MRRQACSEHAGLLCPPDACITCAPSKSPPNKPSPHVCSLVTGPTQNNTIALPDNSGTVAVAAAQPLALAANGTLSLTAALLTVVGAVRSGSIVSGLPSLQRSLLLCCLPENSLQLASTACHVASMLVCRLPPVAAGFGPIDLGSSNLTAGSADLQNTTTEQLTVLGPTLLGTGGGNASLQVIAPSTFQAQVQLQGTLYAQRGVVLGSTVNDSLTVAASALFLSPLRTQGGLTVAGNATIGTEPANLLLINATVVAAGPITAAQLTAAQLTVQGSTVLGTAGSNASITLAAPAAFQLGAQMQGPVILGSSSSSRDSTSLAVNAPLVTIGASRSDSLVVNSTSNFSSMVLLQDALAVAGPAGFQALNASGLATFSGEANTAGPKGVKRPLRSSLSCMLKVTVSG